MMTETLNGLHSCKPGNDPIAGQVKTFTIDHRTSKTGKPWLKIKSAPPDQGGQPYRIVSAEKTDFVDNHGNVSYNVEIEPTQLKPPTPDFHTWQAQKGSGLDE